jgi:hypothetical protein
MELGVVISSGQDTIIAWARKGKRRDRLPSLTGGTCYGWNRTTAGENGFLRENAFLVKPVLPSSLPAGKTSLYIAFDFVVRLEFNQQFHRITSCLPQHPHINAAEELLRHDPTK